MSDRLVVTVNQKRSVGSLWQRHRRSMLGIGNSRVYNVYLSFPQSITVM